MSPSEPEGIDLAPESTPLVVGRAIVPTYEFTDDYDLMDTLRACRWCDPVRYPSTVREPPRRRGGYLWF